MELVEFWYLRTGSALLFGSCIKVPSSFDVSHREHGFSQNSDSISHTETHKHIHREH